MSNIDDLITKLCPDGVEHRHLWEVTAWDKKFNAVENHKQKKVLKYHYLLAAELKSLKTEAVTLNCSLQITQTYGQPKN